MLISENAYLVLGLGTEATEKNINKRYKEQLNILGIDEIPEYDTDISFIDYKDLRTEENIKKAFHELSNEKKKLYQMFFWFQIVDDQDELLYGKLCNGKELDAVNGWYNLYEETGKFHYLKNYAVGDLLLFENQDSFDKLDFSEDGATITEAFYNCINSDTFWKEFQKIINLDSETEFTNDEIKLFRGNISQYLAEAFFDISEDVGDQNLYIAFNDLFGLSAKELDDNENVTKPINTIEKLLKELSSCDDDIEEIKSIVKKLKAEITKLNKLGLGDSTKIAKLRDTVAQEILTQAIHISNEFQDYNESLSLLKQADAITHSSTIKAKIKKNMDIIQDNISHSGIMDDIKKLGECPYSELSDVVSRVRYDLDMVDLDSKEMIKDTIAAVLLARAIKINNEEQNYSRALHVLSYAEEFACGQMIKNKISANKSIFKSNKSSGGLSWGAIILITIFCWPIGLVLIIIKLIRGS